jgi:energy-coupling factor transporter transmembrane protein EcfT
LAIVTFLLHALFTPGKIIIYNITQEGVQKGALLGLKLFMAMGYSLAFILSTPIREVAESLDWITFKRLRLGDTLSLSLKFIDYIRENSSQPLLLRIKAALYKIKSAKYKA